MLKLLILFLRLVPGSAGLLKIGLLIILVLGLLGGGKASLLTKADKMEKVAAELSKTVESQKAEIHEYEQQGDDLSARLLEETSKLHSAIEKCSKLAIEAEEWKNQADLLEKSNTFY